MTIALIILAVALTGMTVSGVICYRRFAVRNMLPLSEQELELCAEESRSDPSSQWVESLR